MFRTSNVLATVLALAAIGASVTAAPAMSVSQFAGAAVSLLETVRGCPPGTHPGYEGKYCWRNHEKDPCPPGFHLGYEDKYCWRNR
jgi:hypothetical protein